MAYLKKNSLAKKLNRFKEIGKPNPVFVYGSDQLLFFGESCTFVNQISKKLKQNIESMKKTAANHQTVSLSANQAFLLNRIFVVNNEILFKNYSKWYISDQKEDNYKTYINPTITHIVKEMQSDWEYCVSLPYLKANVPRFKKIKINYFNENMEEITEIVEGFPARILQHECDHINGNNLLDWRVSFGDLEILDIAKEDFSSLNTSLINLKEKLNNLKEKFPNLFNFYTNDENYKNEIIENNEKFYEYNYAAFRDQQPFSIESELYGKIMKAATKDYSIKIHKLDEELKKANFTEGTGV